MKKAIYILTILTIAVLLITACKSTDMNDEPEPQVVDDISPSENQEPTPQIDPEEKVDIPSDTYTIKPTDTSEKFIMKYKIDSDNKWKVESVTFEMRNFDNKAITPRVTLIVGSGVGEMEVFDYDEIPSGYKMVKQENVNMDVTDEHVFIKATLSDKSTGKEIESVNYDYFAG
ncbi:hypothetical protein ACFL6I_13785 [candidate division KSB1 bacterium]